ncbi:hypothetical protein B0T25DRAFT_536256 [Lasiosphaeria hispida]|uniref:Heterokaryon incompatibility domain-containing protein n=1 Tax=Lasiosphaeria hispida TaxID=260671 RepID=A0AAJ0HSX6_9PEZI|nr:hypothetical protein B0T25DRAFT_536256 [Lasiosphaeria hispida]
MELAMKVDAETGNSRTSPTIVMTVAKDGVAKAYNVSNNTIVVEVDFSKKDGVEHHTAADLAWQLGRLLQGSEKPSQGDDWLQRERWHRIAREVSEDRPTEDVGKQGQKDGASDPWSQALGLRNSEAHDISSHGIKIWGLRGKLGYEDGDLQGMQNFAPQLLRPDLSGLCWSLADFLAEKHSCEFCQQFPVDLPLQTLDGSKVCDELLGLGEKSKICKIYRLILSSIGPNSRTDENGVYNILAKPRLLSIKGEPTEAHAVCLPKVTLEAGQIAASPGQTKSIPIQPESGSRAEMLICKEWLRVCDDQHRHTDSHITTLPKRVLDVGDGASDIVFLRTTTKAQGTYIALSHRWNHDTPTTVHANLDARRAGIKVSDLPAIYQDAIRFTQNLGLRFLWIDSLCIIQDDRTDWYFESGKMANVFSDAYVTIAISPSAGVTGNPSFEQHVGKGELSSRAWILQERALARRTIHFTPGQTYWECGAAIWSLTEDEGERPSTTLSSSNFPQAGPQNAPEDEQTVFKQVFEHYSRLRITVKADRPVAIWGLERRLGAFYGTDSFYGIVKSFFLESLLWQRGSVWMEPLVDHKEDIHSRLNEVFTIPSWSWMVYAGDIRYKPVRLEGLSWRDDVFLTCKESGIETKKERGEVIMQSSRSFCVLTVPLARMRSGCQFDYLEDTNCRVTYAGRAVGWARYDSENAQMAGHRECVRLGEGCMGWEGYAGVNSDEWVLSGQFSFVMLLKPLVRGIYGRIGVGVVLSKHLSRRGKTVQIY